MKKENLLSSWKEIASYLDCDVRTCHRWEKEFGLPVHRLGDSVRSRVFAYREELDRWMAERGNNNHRNGVAAGDSTHKPINLPGRRLAILAVLLLAAAAAVYLIFFNNPGSASSGNSPASQRAMTSDGSRGIMEEQSGASADPEPADFKIDGSELIITNKTGRELFRHDTGLEDLGDEAYFRDHFQNKTLIYKIHEDGKTLKKIPISTHLIIKDLEKDGRREVLFVPLTKSGLGEETLFCLSDRGEKLWEYRTGRPLKYGDIEFPDQYIVSQLGTEDIDGDGSEEILLVSSHNDDFPTQFLVLNAEGEKKGEYWNAGRMMDWATHDINEDGRKEILVAAMNNELVAPALIVFDQDYVEGSSPQQKYFWTCGELKPGREMYYIRFPSDLDVLFPELIDGLCSVDVFDGELIKVETIFTGAVFYLDLSLVVKNIRLTHRYQKFYNDKLGQRRITEPFDHDRIAARLKPEIRWWDGDTWVTTPTMTKYWRR